MKKKFSVLMLSLVLVLSAGITINASMSTNNSVVPVVSGLDNSTINADSSGETPTAVAGAVAGAVARAVTKGVVYLKEAAKHYSDDLERVMRDASMYNGGAEIVSSNTEAVEEIFDLN